MTLHLYCCWFMHKIYYQTIFCYLKHTFTTVTAIFRPNWCSQKKLTTECIQRGLATIHRYDNVTTLLSTGRSHGNWSRLLATKVTKFTFSLGKNIQIKHGNYSLKGIFMSVEMFKRVRHDSIYIYIYKFLLLLVTN